MVKYYKYFLFIFGIFILMFIPNNVFAAEVEQSKTINSSIGKISLNVLDNQDMPLTESNTNMSVGGGNYYYIAGNTATRTSYFRRYFTNMTTNIVNGTSYHVRIVFLREPSIAFTPINNRCLNNKPSVQINGANASNVSSSITRESSSNVVNGVQLVYDRFDVYFTANQTSTSLSISLGELTSCSYMYWNTDLQSQDEHDIIGINGIYVWNNAVDGGTNEQDMIAQQKQTNSFLGSILQKISDFQTMVHNLLEDIKEKIDNFKNMVQQKFNDLLDFLTDTSLDSDTIEDFFDSITPYENSSVAYPITSLLSFLGGTHTICSPITLTTWNTSFQIPCGTTLFWSRSDVSNFRYIWCIIVGGGIVFSLGVKLFKVVQNAVNPKKDDLGGV